MILVKSNYMIWPSRWLGLPEDEVDEESERAFIIASIQKEARDRKKAEDKAKQKAKSRRK